MRFQFSFFLCVCMTCDGKLQWWKLDFQKPHLNIRQRKPCEKSFSCQSYRIKIYLNRFSEIVKWDFRVKMTTTEFQQLQEDKKGFSHSLRGAAQQFSMCLFSECTCFMHSVQFERFVLITWIYLQWGCNRMIFPSSDSWPLMHTNTPPLLCARNAQKKKNERKWKVKRIANGKHVHMLIGHDTSFVWHFFFIHRHSQSKAKNHMLQAKKKIDKMNKMLSRKV